MSKQQQVQLRTSSDRQKESEGNPRVGMAEMAAAKHLGSQDGKFTSLSIVLSVAITGFFATTAQAGLVLNIDKSAKTFSLTGNDTGEVPAYVLDAENGHIKFEVRDGEDIDGMDLYSYSDMTAFTTSVGQPGPDKDMYLIFSKTSNMSELELFTTVPGEMTITGTGTPYSYASFGADIMSRFEGLIGSSLELKAYSGVSGWGSIPVVSSVVPEPSTLLLGMLGLAGFALVRRRLRSIS
jgi:hypothetical protein